MVTRKCRACTKPAENGKSACRPCLRQAAAYAKARYWADPAAAMKRAHAFWDRHRALGICLQCSETAVEGQRLCEVHRERHRTAEATRRRALATVT